MHAQRMHTNKLNGDNTHKHPQKNLETIRKIDVDKLTVLLSVFFLYSKWFCSQTAPQNTHT